MELCCFLLSEGRRIDQCDITHRTLGCDPHPPWPYVRFGRYRDELDLQMHRLLVEDLLDDVHFDGGPTRDTQASDWAVHSTWLGALTPDSLKRLTASFALPFTSWPIWSRVRLAQSIEPSLWDPVDHLKAARVSVDDLATASRSVDSHTYRTSMLSYSLSGVVLSRGQRQERWLSFLRLLDLQLESGFPEEISVLGALTIYFVNSLHTVHDPYLRILRAWLCLLVEEGIDLVAYGQSESRRFIPKTRVYCEGYECDMVQSMQLIYGPDVDDWDIERGHTLSSCLYRLDAAPGAWPATELMPKYICWRPTAKELTEGLWTPVPDTEWSCSSVENRASSPPKEDIWQRCHFEYLSLQTQDDSGVVANHAGRARRGQLTRRSRSSSQPPRRKCHHPPVTCFAYKGSLLQWLPPCHGQWTRDRLISENLTWEEIMYLNIGKTLTWYSRQADNVAGASRPYPGLKELYTGEARPWWYDEELRGGDVVHFLDADRA